MILLGIVSVEQSYRAINWTTIIMIGAMMPLSTAMYQSGAAAMLGETLVRLVGDAGPYALLAGLFLLTGILGQLISNTATALIIIPISVAAARQLGISPQPVLMSVAVAAAASFLTPVATPVNLMVMGPGGYRFGDYWKLGLPLMIWFGIVSVFLVPLIWRCERTRGTARRSRPKRPLCLDRPSAPSRTGARAGSRGVRAVPRGRRRPQRRRLPRPDGGAPDLFGLCVVGTNGAVYGAGDFDHLFSIMSVSKPFVFALVCQELGAEEARRRLGVNATGLPFNSLEAIERGKDGRTNPMVNSGAIATTSLVPGEDSRSRWRFIHEGLSRFAGHELPMNEEVLASATATNARNQAIARLLQACGRIELEPAEAVDLYTRQCSLSVTAKDLAIMGATLADGGVNPLTRVRVVDADCCGYALAVMVTAGLYENSGDWLYDIGLPGKSGIGGGIVTVSPGKGGLGTFAPPLDQAGNSVRGQLAARFLSEALGLSLFASKPEPAAS